MINNLLDGWFQVDPVMALLYALIGFVFVFIGITVLIVILNILGLIMKAVNNKGKKEKEKEKAKKAEPIPSPTVAVPSEEIPTEVKAAIMAAIMAYYSVEKPKCEFVVKQIKRI